MSQGKSEKLGRHEPARRDVWITMSGVGLALFMASLDQTIVATAMPRIVRELGGFESYSGVVTAYMIASTAVMPIVGKLSDVHGANISSLAAFYGSRWPAYFAAWSRPCPN